MSQTTRIDATGLLCPLPVLKLAKQIKRAAPGDVIELCADDPAAVSNRIRRMVTDITGENPRLRATDPGVVEYNPAFLYHDAFNDNADEVAELKERYTAGAVSDREVKERLTDAVNRFLEPIRERRAWYEEHPDYVRDVLLDGTQRERAIARQTMDEVRQAMQVVYT